MDTSGEELVIVSDLHLGPGPLECVESFYNDNAFAGFLDHLREWARAEDWRFRLVVLGDLIDLLRAELVTNPRAEPLDESMALATLERVIEGHPKVFDALSRFRAIGLLRRHRHRQPRCRVGAAGAAAAARSGDAGRPGHRGSRR